MKLIIYFIALTLCFSCERKLKSGDSHKSDTLVVKESINSTQDSIIEKFQGIGKVKVYIENTLSMYGYLPKKSLTSTDFRNAVNELLIGSKSNYKKTNVELFLINNKASVSVDINNNLDKIDKGSLEGLYKQGNRSSDFDKLFAKIIKDWKQDELVVFIADFIYSPPRNETEVLSGLTSLRQNITDAFQNAKNSAQLGTNILHLESNFYGDYYDNDNSAITGIKSRPYYIFILGNEKNVKEYSEKVVPQLKRYNLKNEYYISPSSTDINNYSALPFTLNTGQFESNGFSQETSQIKDIKVKNSLSQNSSLQLAISVDLNDIPVSGDYLLNPKNYNLNDNRIELIDIGLIKNNSIHLNDGFIEVIKSNDMTNAKNSTHAFLISFPSTYKGVIELSLKKNMPEWIKKVSIKDGEDDRDIKTNVLKQFQTFGFSYIVEGIYDAQIKAHPENEYFLISLNVEQETSGSGFVKFIGWFIGFLIIGIIAFIIIRNKQRK